MKHATDVRDEGFTGKDIASQLGDRWRKLTQIERNNFKFQAFTLKEVNRSPDRLDRTKSVLGVSNKSVISAASVTRRYSF